MSWSATHACGWWSTLWWMHHVFVLIGFRQVLVINMNRIAKFKWIKQVIGHRHEVWKFASRNIRYPGSSPELWCLIRLVKCDWCDSRRSTHQPSHPNHSIFLSSWWIQQEKCLHGGNQWLILASENFPSVCLGAYRRRVSICHVVLVGPTWKI